MGADSLRPQTTRQASGHADPPSQGQPPASGSPQSGIRALPHIFGRGDDTVGNPRRAQIAQFELFELVLLLKLDQQFPVEQFEADSTLPSQRRDPGRALGSGRPSEG